MTLLTLLLAPHAGAESSHLNQSVESHVALQQVETEGPCANNPFFRVLADGLADGPFFVPEGYALVITDVDWQARVPSELRDPEASVYALMQAFDGVQTRGEAFVSRSLQATHLFVGSSEQLTTGVVIEAEQTPCLRASVSRGVGDVTTTNTLDFRRAYLRGYLIAAPTSASDDDGDGVPNDQDACPGTPADAKVDAQGCSREQFCNGVDPYQDYGYACWEADWKDDEPTKQYPYDCRLSGGKCVAY